MKGTNSRVESGKEFILDEHFTPGESSHHRGFSSIGSSERRNTHLPRPSLPPINLFFLHALKFSLELCNPITNFSSIQLKLTFARATTRSPLATVCRLTKPWCQIIQLSNFNLKFCSASFGMTAENLENHACSIQNFNFQRVFNVSKLRGGQITVKNGNRRRL